MRTIILDHWLFLCQIWVLFQNFNGNIDEMCFSEIREKCQFNVSKLIIQKKCVS